MIKFKCSNPKCGFLHDADPKGHCPVCVADVGYSTMPVEAPRFDKTFCSQCGREFGPGDSGFSHCSTHHILVQVKADAMWAAREIEQLRAIASSLLPMAEEYYKYNGSEQTCADEHLAVLSIARVLLP